MVIKYLQYIKVEIILLAFAVIIFCCKKEDLKREAKVDTKAVSEILATTAKATGDIIDGITDHGHCWGLTKDPKTSGFKTSLGSSTVEGIYTFTITNLVHPKLYHVRPYLKSSDKVLNGDDIQLTTLSLPRLIYIL
jgi:hypothetical protein